MAGRVGIILGTNALVGLGLRVIHATGIEVQPQSDHGESQSVMSVLHAGDHQEGLVLK